MDGQEVLFLIAASIFLILGLHALLISLIDPRLFIEYGFVGIWLLIPGSVLFLAAFQSKIRFSTNDSVKT